LQTFRQLGDTTFDIKVAICVHTRLISETSLT